MLPLTVLNVTIIEHQLFKVNVIQCILKVHTAASFKSVHSGRTVIQASAAVCCRANTHYQERMRNRRAKQTEDAVVKLMTEYQCKYPKLAK